MAAPSSKTVSRSINIEINFMTFQYPVTEIQTFVLNWQRGGKQASSKNIVLSQSESEADVSQFKIATASEFEFNVETMRPKKTKKSTVKVILKGITETVVAEASIDLARF